MATLGSLAQAGDLDAIERSMRWESKSANDPAQSHEGYPALYWAAKVGHAPVVEALLRQAACVVWQHPTTGSTALLAATSNGHVAVVELLLQQGKADPNVRSSATAGSLTPLIMTAIWAFPSCAELLLLAGADASYRAGDFGTALETAEKKASSIPTAPGHPDADLCRPALRVAEVLRQIPTCQCRQRLAFARGVLVNGAADGSGIGALPYDLLQMVSAMLPMPSYALATTGAAPQAQAGAAEGSEAGGGSPEPEPAGQIPMPGGGSVDV